MLESEPQLSRLLPEQAEENIYGIWLKFELSPKSSEDIQARRLSLKEVSVSLSPEAEAYLDEEVKFVTDVGVEYLPRGRRIVLRAQQDARQELGFLRVQKIASIEKHPSKGERLSTRRKKAQQRHGTNPHNIH